MINILRYVVFLISVCVCASGNTNYREIPITFSVGIQSPRNTVDGAVLRVPLSPGPMADEILIEFAERLAKIDKEISKGVRYRRYTDEQIRELIEARNAIVQQMKRGQVILANTSGGTFPAQSRAYIEAGLAKLEEDVKLEKHEPNQQKKQEAKYLTKTVYFATDRLRLAISGFGGDRGASLSYGSCKVSIPRDHRIGDLESPISVLNVQFARDPARHVLLLSTQVTGRERFLASINERLRKAGRSNALVFIHGYNVTFEDAARRTAQISYDLVFDGPSLFYSWPSQGDPKKYPTDETNIEWTEAHLRQFLEILFANVEAKNIYVIAHSMGTRGLARVLPILLAEHPDYATRLREVILAAPDIDADTFKGQIAPRLVRATVPITMYASSDDRAIRWSKGFHDYKRAGDSTGGVLIVHGVDSIDASGLDTGFFRHSYFAEAHSVVADLYQLIGKGLRAEDRTFTLIKQSASDGSYWTFRK